MLGGKIFDEGPSGIRLSPDYMRYEKQRKHNESMDIPSLKMGHDRPFQMHRDLFAACRIRESCRDLPYPRITDSGPLGVHLCVNYALNLSPAVMN